MLRFALVFITAIACAAAPPKAPDFTREVRPILSDHCFACHGPDDQDRKAGVRLDTREGALQKIVPGDLEKSRVWKRISAPNPKAQMPPPGGKPLTAKQIDILKRWIESGAAFDSHWSFTKPARPAEPPVAAKNWPRNPIDRFLLARLEKEGLRPSPEANRATLLRRLSLDLTGLPPTPAEIDAFLKDRSATAFESQVDRLLASPRFGERMALAWLDLARYADTHGFHIDSHRDMWRWRDWVIQAFNENKPYDRFVVEQLAGDLLPNATRTQILASGFNRNHMINFEGGAIPEEYQNEYLVDRVNTTSTVFLGLTMKCAQCHDHKYDPIKQRDFYRFAAFFNGLPEKGLDGQKGNAAPVLALPSEDQEQRQKRVLARIPEVEKELASNSVKKDYEAWQRAARIPEPPREALRAHYECDGSLADSSGHYLHARSLRDEVGFSASPYGGRSCDMAGRSEVELGPLPLDGTLAFWFRSGARTGRTGILSRMDAERRGWEIFLDDPWAIPRTRQLAHLVIRKIERWPDRVWEARTKEGILSKGSNTSNLWMHIALSGNQLFVNGEPRELTVLRNTLTAPFREPAEPTVIGGRVEADRLRGRLDDLRFYSRALTSGEIQSVMTNAPLRALLATPPAQRAREQETYLRDWYLAHAAPESVRLLNAELQRLNQEREDLVWEIPTVMVMKEMEKPRDTYLLARGDYRNKSEKVTPGTPAFLPPLGSGPANRLALAGWLVHPDHPLTARVAVNRLWQMIFGAGLVKTSEDFGSQGEPPSHPELLDWLATEYLRTGWDTKALLRLIVTSAAYRQSSQSSPALKEKDPENRLLARGPRFRLPAELVRDNALAVSGLLNSSIGGPPVNPYQPPGIWEEIAYGAEFSAQVFEQSHGADLHRRSMYTFWKRTAPPASLATFDAPDREVCVARRPLTNTPLQALVLLNDPTYVEAARALAQRAITEAGPSPARRVETLFRHATGRRPVSAESAPLLALARGKTADYRKDPAAAEKLLAVGEWQNDPKLDRAELAAWTTVASVVLNLDETITKE